MRAIAAIIPVLMWTFATTAGAQTPQPSQSSAGLIHRASSPSAAAAASTASSQPASAARGAAEPVGTFRVVLSLAAVLGLIVLMYWASRRMLPRQVLGGGTRAIQILARAPLSPKHRVVLLQVGRRVLVVAEGNSAQPLNTLCEITDPDEAAALIGQIRGEQSAAGGKSFASRLSGATERFRASSTTATETETAAGSEPPASDGADPLATTQQQLDDLTQRVRGLARHFERV